MSTAPLIGHLSSLAWSLESQAEKPPTIENPNDSVPLLKAGDSLSCVPFCALQAEVQPQCGRAVGFSSGTENPHGVKAVTRGQRCAIALWFTLDARHSERVRGWCCCDREGRCWLLLLPPPHPLPRPLADGFDIRGALGSGVQRDPLLQHCRCGCFASSCLALLPTCTGSPDGGPKWRMTLALGSSLGTTSAVFAQRGRPAGKDMSSEATEEEPPVLQEGT